MSELTIQAFIYSSVILYTIAHDHGARAPVLT